MQPRHRYLAYAGSAALAAAAWLAVQEPPEETALGSLTRAPPRPAIDLPDLTASPANDDGSVKRDLFRVAMPEPAPPPPVAPAALEPPPPPPPPPLDRLAGLSVIGLVARGQRLAILVETGDGVITVETGQQFGKDEALVIDGIQNNRVLVTDKLANVTKTFQLSEE
jgi:hypothetical protein